MYPQVLEAAKQYLKDETRLDDIRHYVSALKNAKFEWTDEMTDVSSVKIYVYTTHDT